MADQKPDPELPPRVLLVEGQDDLHVVEHLRQRQRAIEEMPSFEVVVKGNDAELLKSVMWEVKVEGREVVGVLIDSDDDVAARWQAVRDRLPDGYDLTDRPVVGGAIIETVPRVGVWLMPDNESAGEIEDFVSRMVPSDDPVWPRAERYIDGIPDHARQFPTGKVSRAKLYAWLATRRDPRRMGEAIRTRDLATDGALCQQFVEWLRRLFG